MDVEVLYFAHAARLAGTDRERVDLEEGGRVADLKRWMLERHPELAGIESTLLFAVDEELSHLDRQLSAHQTVAVMPPFSGG